jgi:hypothetical protein
MGRTSTIRHKVQFQVYKDSVTGFFNNYVRWNKVYPYLKGEKFSRRFLEHFITEYARANKCEYYLEDTGEKYLFNVYHSAQSVLLGVHKRHMDPFSRKNLSADNEGFFTFGYGEKICDVTVCELNFFRWALKKGVLAYAEKHQEEIKEDMARLARLKREFLGKRKDIEEVVIELPDGSLAPIHDAIALADHPLQDQYWKTATAEKMQQPRKQRKRYRRSAVSTVFNNELKELDTFT